jgi:DNA-binding CsgD family transcriptional regulator
MLPEKRRNFAALGPKSYPLGEKAEPSILAVVALSHTQVEHRIYSAMLSAAVDDSYSTTFTTRLLMAMTGIRSLGTIRRGLDGLMAKLSIERDANENGSAKRERARAYHVYTPAEIIARRKEQGNHGSHSHSQAIESRNGNPSFDRAITRVAENRLLSRREAQVALYCVEGLTNAEIGKRLNVSDQTVKFHLRHIFIKFGVKRRAELISRLLS